MKALILVFIGGGVGSICRYLVSTFTNDTSTGFPFKTFTANFISCFILGLLMGYFLRGGIDDKMKLLLLTGFCGGFSTFSTFSGEVFTLIENHQMGMAIMYIIASVVICTLILFFGYLLGQQF